MKKATALLIIIAFFLSIFTIFLPVETCEAAGNIIYVDDSGGANYTSIQDALDAADPGDMIYVYSGTYGKVEIVIDITIIGENRDNTIIDGGNSGHVVKVTGTAGDKIQVNISGFTIQNAGGSGFDGIHLSYVSYGTIENNRIRQNDVGEGIQMDHCNDITIKDNIISDNIGASISLTLSTDNVIHSNVIHGNKQGIYMYYNSNNNEIYDNTVSGNSEEGFEVDSSSSGNVFYINKFLDNGQNAYDSSTNDWDDEGSQQGNYWDDYNGYDNDSNDIGDSAYNIPGGSNKDNYPLGYFLGENQKPNAYIDSISPNPAEEGQTVYFNGHGTDDGTVVQWEWKSNKDGILISSEDFSSSSLSVGTHTIQFRVKDDDGDWSDYDTSTLVINSKSSQNQKPTATIVTISPDTSTYGDRIDFHGYGIDTDGIVVEYSWRSSRDGVLSSQSTFSKSDLSVGFHTIYFKVKDDDSLWSDEVSKNIIVNPGSTNSPPVAITGGPYSGYVNISISFDASGCYDPDDDEIVSYVWDFGDGENGTGVTVEHVYSSAGNYTVNLTVTDSQGKSSTNSTYVNVSIQPSSQNGDGGASGVPGFEIFFVIIAIAFIVFWKKLV